MPSKLDFKTTSFDVDGRISQLEFSMETINSGNPVIGIKIKEGIIIATGKNDLPYYSDSFQFSTKIFLLEENIFCAITGSNPDAQALVDNGRIQAQQFKQTFQEIIPLKKIVNIICDIKQKFTQTGGKRPFGTSLIIGGFDSVNGFQIFRTEPSGNYSEWKAVAVGSNSITNQAILDEEFKIDLTLEDALKLILKIFYKKIKSFKLSNRIEIFILKHDDKQKIVINCLSPKEIDSLVKNNCN
ncbi:prsA3 (nucleomorph) [Hemiselmis andersenii]|uniref:PrsA3 n=1 Tax=Hemiselmis andersenii TaxID=464988 RepID=A9BK31_HEMAN|nr:prsA3 [Hemiselmis andersenii]ABW97864.1 prsA3 [Hemiselmis andersenii]|mmetsp:Transcript_26764/g.61962  ORF Transcript_26764/g.61962 Transcript_26764/m.61962 type:complete len:242 (+) Transcript_26764:785-1510(+)